MRIIWLLSFGANAILLALFAWLWVVTQESVLFPWILYVAAMGGLSTYALRKERGRVRA